MPAPHHSVFLHAGCPTCHPTNSIKALKAERDDDAFKIPYLEREAHELVYISVTVLVIFIFVFMCLQCFDTVGWVSGRASGL